jgi:hypothetical protein
MDFVHVHAHVYGFKRILGYEGRRWSLCVMPPHTHVVLMIRLTYQPLSLKVLTNVWQLVCWAYITLSGVAIMAKCEFVKLDTIVIFSRWVWGGDWEANFVLEERVF